MATWLNLVPDQEGWSLVDTGRMGRITQQMGNPAHQFPSMLFCLGRTVKVQALQSLFRRNNITRRDGPGMARLHLSSTTARTQHPVWVIDGELQTRARPVTAPPWPRLPLSVDGHLSYQELQHVCYARLLLPFVDVVCLFADDLGGLEKVHELLQLWTRVGAQNTATYEGRPQLIVVDSSGEIEWQQSLADLASSPWYRQCFADVPVVVHLRDRLDLSPCARFEPLRTTIRDQLQAVRRIREERHLLLSAVHLTALSQAAIRALTKRPAATFDIILAAREGNSVDDTLGRHLTTFVTLAAQAGLSDPDVVSFIASALLLDGYPPGMHREWPSFESGDLV